MSGKAASNENGSEVTGVSWSHTAARSRRIDDFTPIV
jgi:hypothetical protein